jgi:hypothetical protein
VLGFFQGIRQLNGGIPEWRACVSFFILAELSWSGLGRKQFPPVQIPEKDEAGLKSPDKVDFGIPFCRGF